MSKVVQVRTNEVVEMRATLRGIEQENKKLQQATNKFKYSIKAVAEAGAVRAKEALGPPPSGDPFYGDIKKALEEAKQALEGIVDLCKQ